MSSPYHEFRSLSKPFPRPFYNIAHILKLTANVKKIFSKWRSIFCCRLENHISFPLVPYPLRNPFVLEYLTSPDLQFLQYNNNIIPSFDANNDMLLWTSILAIQKWTTMIIKSRRVNIHTRTSSGPVFSYSFLSPYLKVQTDTFFLNQSAYNEILFKKEKETEKQSPTVGKAAWYINIIQITC